MPRGMVKKRTQVQLCTWVQKEAMEDAKAFKAFSGQMIADQVRDALWRYYSELREQGAVPPRPSEPPLESWQPLPTRVRSELLAYFTCLMKEYKLPPEERKGLIHAQDVFAAQLSVALEEFYEAKKQSVRLGEESKEVHQGGQNTRPVASKA